MDVRKIVSFGNSSFVISLPKAWVIKNSLKKGDTVAIEERNSELIVYARDKSKKEQSSTRIECESKSINELKTMIYAAYVNNYGSISLAGTNIKNNSAELKKIIHGLVGMEVVEETASLIVVKDLMDLSEVSIDSLVRRMDLLLKSMLEDSMSQDKVDSVQERDKEINRLALLSARVFKAATENPSLLRIFQTTYWDVYVARQVAFQLEHIGDNVKRASRLMASKKPAEELKKIYMQLCSRYAEVMKAYYSKDKNQAFKLESDTRKFLVSLTAYMEKNKDPTYSLIVEKLNNMTKDMIYIMRTVIERD